MRNYANLYHSLRFLAAILLAAISLWHAQASAAADRERVLTFGVVPQQAASTLLRSWGPVLRHLQDKTGYRFVFRTAPDIPTFEDRLAVGEYDFAYMNPYHFTVFNEGELGYQAVARAANKRIQGILVVRKDSPIQALSELNGAQLAFPAPAAFAASVIPRASLEAGGIRFQSRYVSSHDSVYQAVAKGLFPAGGGVLRTFNATAPDVREQLRVLWTTPAYTPHAIAAKASLEPEVVARVRQVLVALAEDENAATLLSRLKIRGFSRRRPMRIGTTCVH